MNNIDKRTLRSDILLLLTAAIWGFGFVAQRSGMEHIGPFAFNGIRFILGSLSLLPFIFFRRSRSSQEAAASHGILKEIIYPSLAAGGCLFIAVILQQLGIIFTTAGNAGFITGLYVVLTPFFAIILGRKTGIATWIGCILSFAGLYFISVAGRPSINPGDMLIFISSFFWAAHVLLIDYLMQGKRSSPIRIDPVILSSGQFAVCGILSLLGSFLVEPYIAAVVERINPQYLGEGLMSWLPFPELIACVKAGVLQFPVQAVIPILYGGLASVGIGYTFQIIAQKDAPPAHAVIILCFEGCFAVIGGILLLGETAGGFTLLGCAFMLAGMIISQFDIGLVRQLG